MASFWNIVNTVIEKSDVILEVLDARLIDQTRNAEIEDKVKKAGKKLIFVLNKADLAKGHELTQKKTELAPCILVSAKEHQGTIKLREIIKKVAKQKNIVVGVVGYPNTGKSSIINALKGKSSAPTSSLSGYTKGIQKVNIGGGIILLDTPGVIPYKEKERFKHAVISAVDPSKVKDPDMMVARIIEQFPGMIEDHYGVELHKDPLDTIEEIAIKKKKLKKGGTADIDAMSRIILRDYHSGKLR